MALDVARGLAVLLMVEQHLGYWLWHMDGRDAALFAMAPSHPIFVGLNALGGLAAPLFFVLAGAGAALLAARSPRPGAVLALRGLGLVGLGFALNLAAPSWFRWGSFYVLHGIGCGLALAALVRRLPSVALLGLAFVVLAGTVLLQNAFATPSPLGNTRMSDITLPGGPLRLALVEGHFPLFPWFAFLLSGIVAGRLVAAGRAGRLALVGLGFLTLAGGLYLVRVAVPAVTELPGLERLFRLPTKLYPALPILAAGLIGAALLVTAGLAALVPRLPRRALAPLAALGRASLSILFVHIVLFREVTRPLGLFKALSVDATGLTIVATLAVFIVAALAWQRVGFRYGAEWLLRVLTRSLARRAEPAASARP